MRRFVVNILIFSMLMVAGLAACEWYARTRTNVLAYKLDYIKRHGDEVSTLIAGNSALYWGVDAGKLGIDSVFNFAYNGQPLRYTLRYLQLYGHHLPNLRTLVLGMVFCDFFDHPFEATDDWQMEIPYNIYTGFNRHSPLSRYNFEISFPDRFRQIVLPWRTSGEYFRYDSLGHSLNSPQGERLIRWKSSVRWIRPAQVPPDWRYVPENVAAFDSIAMYCRDRGVELVVVETPVHQILRDVIPVAQADLNNSLLASRQRRYGFRRFNFVADPRFTDDDFYDVVHLNTDVGAAHFSDVLADSLAFLRSGSPNFIPSPGVN